MTVTVVLARFFNPATETGRATPASKFAAELKALSDVEKRDLALAALAEMQRAGVVTATEKLE